MEDFTDEEIDNIFKEMLINELIEIYDERLVLLSMQRQNNVEEISKVKSKVNALLNKRNI